MPLEIMLFIDTVIVIVCVVLLLRFADLSHSHPGTIYLIFHIFVVTTRLLSLSLGAPTLYGNLSYDFMAVTHEEIIRAAILFDIALISMTVAFIKANYDIKYSRSKLVTIANSSKAYVSPNIIWSVVIVALPIGIIGLLTFAYIPGIPKLDIELGAWEESSWLLVTQTWVGLSLLSLIYYYGFNRSLLLMLVVYLVIIAMQGYSRFRFLIPLILVIQIYLDRNQKRWPTPSLFTILLIAGLFFFPLKKIAVLIQQNASISHFQEVIYLSINDLTRGQANNQEFLDQCAAALTLIDNYGKIYYGSTYLVLLAAPIPRQIWPDKPTLVEFIRDISQPWRPMFKLGQIVTFIGESYANFRYPGVIIISFISAYWLTRFYFRAYLSPYLSIQRFAYLLVACNLIQVYRDGFISLAVFVLINMMPLAVIILLHYIVRSPLLPHNRYVATKYSVR
jgi:hypothetical protein